MEDMSIQKQDATHLSDAGKEQPCTLQQHEQKPCLFNLQTTNGYGGSRLEEVAEVILGERTLA